MKPLSEEMAEAIPKHQVWRSGARDKVLLDWAERVAQLETENEWLAKEVASTAKTKVQIDGVVGYACVLESMLRKSGVTLPPQPSLIMDVHKSREEQASSEDALLKATEDE